ncbi:N-acetyltransferase [Brachybacterium alimentarium]|uniref:GNAT family N-acetyltransferase n=1 Tax=Brachybacterium alimentarium TaxID=47845 RepID=UPI000DF45135|nr:GNAT family N-acetyltransferase [Brachybacterium alimentarium]RCS90967.1 N-acetyltransferase [Brachybacterium alimentarium]
MSPQSRRTSSQAHRRSARHSARLASGRALGGYHLVEALIAGWRPLQRLDVDGFALLRSRGITRRANSAVAVDAPSDEASLLAAVERIEGLLAMTGERACFRVLDVHGPEALDGLLAARGYDATGHSTLLELPLDRARTAAPHPSAEIRTGALDEDWFEAAWSLAPRDGDDARATMHDILAGTPSVQVLLRSNGNGNGDDDDGAPIAVGRAALVEAGRGTAAILNMIAVDPQRRREGLGRAVSQTLLAIAAVQGADLALLEVEQGNAPAAALYQGLGFHPRGSYHYRKQAGAPPTPDS